MALDRNRMRRWIGTGLGLAIILMGLLPSTLLGAQDMLRTFDSAARLLQSGHSTEALTLYQRIADHTSAPEDAAWALLLKATALNLYLNQPARALGLLETIRTRYPHTAAAQEALFNTGMIAYQQRDYRGAAADFSTYLDRYPASGRRKSAADWLADARAKAAGMAAAKALSPEAYTSRSPIRVLMDQGAGRINITASGTVSVCTGVSDDPLHPASLRPLVFTHSRGKLFLNGHPLSGLRCRVETRGGFLCLHGMRLRGVLKVDLQPDGLQVINQLPIESYLYGIIAKEMPSNWPSNALEAQAVASRTYALYIKAKNRFLPFDLDATTASQVYGGYDAETPQTNAAVDATRGRVMTYSGQLILAYFHANSGGHTENARNVWRLDLPYLRGVPDPFSRGVPNGRWDYPLSFALASRRLNQAGLDIGTIHAIEVLSRSASGRVLSLGLDTDRGQTVLSANRFRMLVDAKGIKSTLFHIFPGPSGVRLRGRGNGHGVGMSQWGACRMAQAGYSFMDILKTYYPGISLKRLGEASLGR